ncbi:hypothetical protein HY480_01625 [Candidatus Uhrbacteria bacterium]|nr:hypothetical protein [Candidatus Uhrbacteria bacterium]
MSDSDVKRPSEEFQCRVREIWGDPTLVAEAALHELWQHTDVADAGEDGREEFAMRVGILAGKLVNERPEDFLAEFERTIWPRALEEDPTTYLKKVERIRALP